MNRKAKPFSAKYTVAEDGCWVWAQSKSRLGYGMVSFNGKQTSAHRVSWMLYRGDIPAGMSVCHTCDNPACVNPGHLWLGTHQQNMADKVAKGRQARGEAITKNRPYDPSKRPRGEGHKLAVLNNDAVKAIRADARSFTAIAGDFGVSRQIVSRIVRGLAWTHV